MSYTNPPHLHENILQNQHKRHRGEKARAGGYAEVRQDKGHFANAPHVLVSLPRLLMMRGRGL